jgi:predicted protein tyrosine phosphatase
MKEMTIKAMSQANIEKYMTDMPHIVISIRDDGCEDKAKLPDNPNRIAELFLDFADMDKPEVGFAFKLFSKEDARAILGLVKMTEPYINTILVNCMAGVSRSAAVAAALSILLGVSDTNYFNPRGPYYPNRLVYRTLLDVAIEENFYDPTRKE